MSSRGTDGTLGRCLDDKLEEKRSHKHPRSICEAHKYWFKWHGSRLERRCANGRFAGNHDTKRPCRSSVRWGPALGAEEGVLIGLRWLLPDLKAPR
jgi:hypothetical protein